MNLPSLIRKPLIAAIVGALTIAVPAGALYLASACARRGRDGPLRRRP